jgi:uncharacterized damage-inducible protein DinB
MEGRMSLRDHFRQLAAYNRWANARLYEAALALDQEAYRRPVGVFFSSLHGTLNHLLLTDGIWLRRLTSEGDHPDRLDAILFDDRLELALARAAEDQRIERVVEGFEPEAYAKPVSYRTTRGVAYEQPLQEILAHLFNHQTHHRGQAHACLSILTKAEPPPLDLLALQRGQKAPAWRRWSGTTDGSTAWKSDSRLCRAGDANRP